MKVTIISGSRADYGLLEWPIKLMSGDKFFEVEVLKIWGETSFGAIELVKDHCTYSRPDLIMLLGDRFEIMGAAFSAHLARVPIAHIAGGDVTEGSYDDAMRDCISRMSSIHFVTSSSAMARLTHRGCKNIHLVGSPGIDYIRHAQWREARPYKQPYVVISYQMETLNMVNDMEEVLNSLPDDKFKIFIMPNPDRGNETIREDIESYVKETPFSFLFENLEHGKFLNLIQHCDEFIGNSSAMLYEAPELQIKTRMIGNRQKGRTIPWGDGHASERIIHTLKYGAL